MPAMDLPTSDLSVCYGPAFTLTQKDKALPVRHEASRERLINKPVKGAAFAKAQKVAPLTSLFK